MRSTEEIQEMEEDHASGFKEKCEVCCATFSSRMTLKEDLARHKMYFSVDGSSVCPLCKLEVAKLNLTAHFNEAHAGNTCCLVCLEVIPNKLSKLRRHIVKTHHGKPICMICGKPQSDKNRLEIHMKLVHGEGDAKDVFCHRCGRTFAHKILLNRHLRVSCGAEEWKCPLCPKIFDTKKKITYHLKVHCPEKPIVCPLCAYSSYKMENMLLHSRKVHHLKGCKDDFFVNENALKRQTEFVKANLEKAKPKNPK